jgi:hypothetical protein
MNSAAAITNFDSFLGGDCEALLRDVEMMLGGASPGNLSAPEIQYAVDFSEIFAFTHPDKTRDEVQLFPRDPDADETQQIGINEYVLDRVFFGHKTTPILLIPYAMELASFVKSVAGEEIAGLMEAAAQLEKLKSDRRLQDVLQTRKGRPNAGLTEEEIREVMRTIEAHAPLLRMYLHDEGRTTLLRLRYLLANAKLRDAKDMYVQQVEMEREIENRWRTQLINLRGASRVFSCKVDARAMAQLVSINQSLRGQNRAVRLVTRSSAMHSLYQRERDKYWRDLDPYMLCHPRSFLFQLDWLPKLANGKEAKLTLERLREGLKFLRSSGSLVRPEAGSPSASVNAEDSAIFANAKDLDAGLRSIRRDWKVLTNLVLSTETESYRKSRSKPRGGSYAFAHSILDLVGHNDKLREAVHRRVQDLGQFLREGMESLPYDAQLSPTKVTESLDNRLALELHGAEPVVLSPKSLRFVNYRCIQFYAPYIRRAAEKKPDGGAEIIGRFVKHRDAARSGEYERRIAMAYLLACNGYWGLAENYCDLALTTPEEAPKVPRHEAEYLLAIIKRIHDRTAARFREGLKHLRTAQELKPEREPDPRYLTEQAAIIFTWRGDPTLSQDPNVPALEDALRASREALEIMSPNDGLRVTIYNNLCFWYLQDDESGDTAKAKKYAGLLNQTLTSIDPKRDRWPPSVLDTVLWAEFKLEAQTDERKLRNLIAQTDKALAIPTISDRDRRALKQHRDAFQATLDKLR